MSSKDFMKIFWALLLLGVGLLFLYRFPGSEEQAKVFLTLLEADGFLLAILLVIALF